jgi:uncharacterized membrane protein YfcA
MSYLWVVMTAVGVATGFLGALGLGSAIFLVPFMIFVLKLPVKLVTGVNLICLLSNSAAAGTSYIKQDLANWRLAIFLGIPMTIGSVGGAVLAVHLPEWMLMMVFGGVFVWMGFVAFLTRRLDNKDIGIRNLDQSKSDGLSSLLGLRGSYLDAATHTRINYEAGNLTVGALLACAAGLTMVVGAGAGLLSILTMASYMNVPIKIAVGTSRLMLGMAALFGSITFFQHGLIEWRIGSAAALGTIIGALIGSAIANRLNSAALKFVSAGFLIYMGYTLFANGLASHFGLYLRGALFVH